MKDDLLKLICLPATEIPATLPQLLAVLFRRQRSSSFEKFSEACGILALIARDDCHALKTEVTSLFRYFDFILAQENPLQSATDFEEVPAAEGSDQSFLSHFLGLLLLAGYRPLTFEQQEAALRDSFKLTVPLLVRWQKLDDQLLSQFWAQSELRQQVRKLLPPSADRVSAKQTTHP
jgi:hypothetical protein